MSDAGDSLHPQLFDHDTMHGVGQALTCAELTHSRAGVRHVLAVQAVRELAREPVLLTIARAYVGAAAFPFRATLFDKSLASNWLVPWHQDTALS